MYQPEFANFAANLDKQKAQTNNKKNIDKKSAPTSNSSSTSTPSVIHCSHTKCDFNCSSKEELKAHISAVHTMNTPVFRCTKCAFMATAKSDLQSHSQLAHPVTKRNDLHINIDCEQTNIEQFKCTRCQYSSIDVELLKIHIKSEHGNTRDTRGVRREGVQPTAKKNVSRKRQINAISSNQSTSTAAVAYVDESEVMNKMSVFECVKCGYKTQFYIYLQQHVAALHSN